MKTVLIIGADFAPSSLPPATRIRFFAKHLPEFGWKPIVVSTKPEFYEHAVDLDNEQLLPQSLEIIRTNAWRSSWTRKFGLGDVGMRSAYHHWRALSKLCKEKTIDLIFIPVPPNFTMALGRLAHMRFGIPYVVDYIDPWVTEYYWKLPRKQRPPKWVFSYALSRILEPFSLRRVRHITGVSKGTTDQIVGRYNWLSQNDATEIPYGAEAGDFDYLREHPRDNKIFDVKDGRLHVCYVGAYVESMAQTLRALFSAFKRGLDQTPGIFERVVLHFIGTTYSTNGADPFRVTAVARACGVAQWVDEHPKRIPYLDSLQVMLDAHALILLGSDEPHYTASKVFPYVLARRPLLAVIHKHSTVHGMLTEASAGRVICFDFDHGPAEFVDEISLALEQILSDTYQADTCWEAFEPYTTNAMAGRLARAFDTAVGTQT